MKTNREYKKKVVNTDQTIRFLNHAFGKAQAKAIGGSGYKNTKGTQLYDYQVDFCYLIDDIQRGSKYIAPKKISEANNLIELVANYSSLSDKT
jgi:hypothetical protein